MEISELIEKWGTPENYSRGEHIFRQGDSSSDLYAIQKGFIKGYYLSNDGKEYVKSFLVEGDMIGSMSALCADKPASFSLICLEDVMTVRLPFEKIYSAAKKDLELSQFFIESLLALAMKKEKREFEFLCLSAEERYIALQKENASILSRATQNDIARYLGITPVALSRIKKRCQLDKKPILL